MPSVATVRTVAAPSIPCSTFKKFPALNEIPYRFSWGMSSGIPSSQVLSRWTDPEARTRTHPGPKAREPAVHSRGAPDT